MSSVTTVPDLRVREATAADHPAVRTLLRSAYDGYAEQLPPAAHAAYLRDLLDLDRHARLGTIVVAEVDSRMAGCAAFYPDIGAQGLGWPAGWAGGRGLAVDPDLRGLGIAARLVAACEERAREIGAPAFAFHTAEFMQSARALYERLGYRRDPGHDRDLGEVLGSEGRVARILAYRRDLDRRAEWSA
jgi:GNAT superfamily N-acetyltransferase